MEKEKVPKMKVKKVKSAIWKVVKYHCLEVIHFLGNLNIITPLICLEIKIDAVVLVKYNHLDFIYLLLTVLMVSIYF